MLGTIIHLAWMQISNERDAFIRIEGWITFKRRTRGIAHASIKTREETENKHQLAVSNYRDKKIPHGGRRGFDSKANFVGDKKSRACIE